MKQVWKDPVWSKVISVGILAVLSLIYAKTKSVIEDITFSQAFQSIFDTKIRIIYIIGIIILFLILKRVFKREGSLYSSKQKKLREVNNSLNQETNILFRWEVYFDYNTPFISKLNAFCTKHEGAPIRFIHDRCSIPDCENNRDTINMHVVKNLIESDLIDRWEKMK